MSRFWQDLRYGLRTLARTPGFTAVAAVTLALGIGANAAIFSVVRAVLLPPLPFANPERLVQIRAQDRNGSQSDWVSYRDFDDWRAENRSFESIGAQSFALLNLTGGSQPDALYGARVSEELLPLLGVPPLLGRFFLPAENRPDQEQVIILSYDLWQRRFAGDRGIVGRTIHLTGRQTEAYTVVGVMPRGFNFPLNIPTAVSPATRQMAYWIPFGVDARRQSRDGLSCLAVGRLKAGVSAAQAQADLDAVMNRVARESPQTNTGRGVRVVPFATYVLGRARAAMLIMTGAAGLLALMACANIANLLLARAMHRRRETAIRMALGAARLSLVRQWITESVLLAALGAGAGLAAAAAGLRLLLRLAPADIPRIAATRVDVAVVAFTAGLALLAGLLCGAFPGWLAAGADPQESLAEGGARLTAGPGRNRTRDLLIAGEVALAVILTIGAGLLVRSFGRLLGVDPGFHADRVLTAIIVLPNSRYPDLPAQVAFWRKLLDNIRGISGLESSGAANGVPLSGNITGAYVTVEGHPSSAAGAARPAMEVFAVSPEYLPTMGIPLLAGRQLTPQDGAGGWHAALVNDLAARRFWPGENPLGKRFSVNQDSGRDAWRQVVGVVKTTHDQSLDQPAQPAAYLPMEQALEPPQFLALRSGLPAPAVGAQLRRAVAAVDKDQPVYVINGMQELLDNSSAPRRFAATMLALFGILALLLAAAGIYALAAYSVSRRAQEIGLRMALGAQRGDVMRLIIRQALQPAVAGIAVGVAGALLLTRTLAGLLYGVESVDPVTFASVPLLLAAVELLACYLPARRAAKMDPLAALRCE